MPLTTTSDFMDRIDYVRNKTPKCPFCDHEIDISANEMYELYEEGEHEIDCPGCEKKIVIQCEIEYTFSTDEQPDFA